MEIAATLRAQEPAVVVVSRMHFEERLSPTVRDALWSAWVPVNLFAYPYQRDMFLFLPVDKGAELLSAPTAVFDHGVRLQDVAAFSLPGADALLVRLRWRAPDPLAASYTIFAHLLDRSGQLVAQKDSIPVAGWRPTTSWGAGEIITDWRWIPLERAIDPQTMQLSIGLYDSMDGSRLALAHPDGVSGGDQFVTSLNFVMEPWNE